MSLRRTKSASVSKRGHPRSLSDMNELFLTLTRLRLDLLEEDLHLRFEIPQTTDVSEIFITWTDRLHYCLSSFDQIPGPEEGLRNLLSECFKGEFEDIDLIIDCTEVFMEKPSDPIAQSATWSEYKEHNTGKILVGLSPVGFPKFVSDAFLGSILMISLRQVKFCLLQGKIKDGLLTKDGKEILINLG